MSNKMECPGCGSYTSAIARALGEGLPCPGCGLSADAALEIISVQKRRGDEALKTQLAEALKRAGAAEAERDLLRRRVENIKYAVEQALGEKLEPW